MLIKMMSAADRELARQGKIRPDAGLECNGNSIISKPGILRNMKKYLITRYSGFVSRHLLEYLNKGKTNASIKGLDIYEPSFSQDAYKNIRVDFEKIDLLDKDRVESILFNFQPDYIVHLASYSSVAFSWKEPILKFE